MRTIQVSPDVFQAIWAARKPGEDDEDAILKRVLLVKAVAPSPPSAKPGKSWFDRRFGTEFPHGFEIFRTYLGKNFRARVENGKWRINDKDIRATTINNLSAAIGAKTENGWVNWNYVDSAGVTKKITDLRDPASIGRRSSMKFSKEFVNGLDINI